MMKMELTHIVLPLIMAVNKINELNMPFVGNDYYCKAGASDSDSWPLFPTILSETVRTVLDVRILVLLLLRCHGLSRLYMRQLVMILNWILVVKTVIRILCEILLLTLLNFTSNNDTHTLHILHQYIIIV